MKNIPTRRVQSLQCRARAGLLAFMSNEATLRRIARETLADMAVAVTFASILLGFWYLGEFL